MKTIYSQQTQGLQSTAAATIPTSFSVPWYWLTCIVSDTCGITVPNANIIMAWTNVDECWWMLMNLLTTLMICYDMIWYDMISNVDNMIGFLTLMIWIMFITLMIWMIGYNVHDKADNTVTTINLVTIIKKVQSPYPKIINRQIQCYINDYCQCFQRWR